MGNEKPHADQRYIEALLSNDRKLIEEIYAQCSGKVLTYVKRNNGNEDDAKDIIQETLIIIYRQAFEKQLVLTCPFEAYFLLLCKRRWLNKVKEKAKMEVTIEEDLPSINKAAEKMTTDTTQYEEKQQIIERQFKALSDKCRELIKLTLEIKSLKTIAEKLGVTYAYVRKKKSVCMGQLTQLVRESKAYKNLNE